MKYHTSKYSSKKILHLFETEDYGEIKKDVPFHPDVFSRSGISFSCGDKSIVLFVVRMNAGILWPTSLGRYTIRSYFHN